MSMTTLAILRFIGMAAAYIFITILLPAYVLKERLKERRFTERLLFYFMTGNFYVMNLVFLLQLLHISNQLTLVIGLLVPLVWKFVGRKRAGKIVILSKIALYARRLSYGQVSLKIVFYKAMNYLKKKLGTQFSRLLQFLKPRWLDVIFALGITIYMLQYFVIPHFSVYGYGASDTLVHMYWVNEMGVNNIFVAGVYPFGFHCVIYFLHAVFGFETYALFVVFGGVETMFIIYMLLAFLKLCCKNKYFAYGGVLFYLLWNGFREGTYSRYFSTLPQEYSMLFILPAIYFGFAFFKRKKQELEEGLEPNQSRSYLIGFAMAFSMSLAAHFYGTIIAALFCVGMAIGYAFLFFRRKYFGRVIGTVLLSAAIAIAPMGIAFATGTPLQGSLGWALSVIEGDEDDESTAADGETLEEGSLETGVEGESAAVSGSEASVSAESSAATGASSGQGTEGTATQSGEGGTAVETQEAPVVEKVSIFQRIGHFIQSIPNSIQTMIRVVCYYGTGSFEGWYGYACIIGIGILLILGVIFFILKKPCYGAMLLSTAFFMLLMSVLQSASWLGAISLMDADRTSIFYAYVMPVEVVFIADAFVYLVFHAMKKPRVRNFVSFAGTAAVLVVLVVTRSVRTAYALGSPITNEAMTCTTNIIRTEAQYQWTIVSANDEYRMTTDYGRHYETIDFLRAMENYNSRSVITIPTEVVYIYIEKIPVDYYEHYEGSGQSISKEGAALPLPTSAGIGSYQGENRWILMSKMYEWAQEFIKLYPNETRVYLETENFICYRVQQNTYHLYNFALDYGYNVAQ